MTYCPLGLRNWVSQCVNAVRDETEQNAYLLFALYALNNGHIEWIQHLAENPRESFFFDYHDYSSCQTFAHRFRRRRCVTAYSARDPAASNRSTFFSQRNLFLCRNTLSVSSLRAVPSERSIMSYRTASSSRYYSQDPNTLTYRVKMVAHLYGVFFVVCCCVPASRATLQKHKRAFRRHAGTLGR